MKEKIKNKTGLKEEYGSYLKGKRVALVGPGHHTKNTKQHDLIESYDVVARMNNGIELSWDFPEDLGTRTNILYCCLNNFYFKNTDVRRPKKRKALFIPKNMSWICECLDWISITHAFKHPGNVRKLITLMENVKGRNIEGKKAELYLVEKDILETIKKSVKKKLSTGIITICDLLSYDIKELYITGMSFWDRKTVKVTNNKVYRSTYMRRIVTANQMYNQPDEKLAFTHDTVGELSFFISLCQNDDRIICDEVLSKIVKANQE